MAFVAPCPVFAAAAPSFAPARVAASAASLRSSARVASNPIRARVFVAAAPKIQFGVFASADLSIQERIQKAISQARAVAEEKGATSKEARVAWDEVEELEAELSHQKAQPKADPLQEFCKENPETDECRLYED
eukprot:tig00020554_g10880.t1